MSKVALVVEFIPKEGCMDAFLEVLTPHAAASREEPGTLRFDVLITREENMVMLYELYADQAALDFHAGTERLAQFRKTGGDLLGHRKVTICDMKDDGGR